MSSLFSKAVIEIQANTENAKSKIVDFQKKFSSSVSIAKTALLGFIGYSGLKAATDSLSRLSDTADKWGIDVSKVSKFTSLFSEFGGSTDEAIESLNKFQEMANNLKFNSSGPLRDLSAKLRVNLNNKDFEGVIKAIKSQWQYLSKDAKAEVQNIIGASAPLRRIFEASKQDFENASVRAEKFGVVSESNANSILKLRIALSEMRQVLTLLAVPVLEILKPFAEILRDIIFAFNSLPSSVKKAIAVLVIAFGAFSKIVSIFKAFSLALTANPIGLIIAGISALILVGTYLYKNWDKLKAKLDALIKRFPFLGKAINMAKNHFKFLFSVVKGVISVIEKAIMLAKSAGKFLGKFLGAGDSNLTIEERNSANSSLASMGIIPSPSIAQNMSTSQSFNNQSISSASQTINIYGVKDSGDMMSNLTSLQTQSLIPTR